MTREMEQMIIDQLKEEKKLLQGTAFDLINGIEPIKPIYYYNRLIAELFPESEYAKVIGIDYANTNKTIIRKRNDLIKAVIEPHKRYLPPRNELNKKGEIETKYMVRLNPNCIYSDVEDTLTRNDKGIAKTFSRQHVFLVALIFNLEYDQMITLLTHCRGERTINFKDPYEVILAYCLKKHTNVCEHYLNLVEQYEAVYTIAEPLNAKYTLQYELEFNKIADDDSLLKFLAVLPNNKNATSANKIFREYYAELKDIFSIQDMSYCFDKIYFKLIDDDKERTEEALKDKRRMKRAGLVTDNQLLEELNGNDFHNLKGRFRFLKKKALNKDKLKKILENKNEQVTKEELIEILFFNYYISGKWGDIIEEISDQDDLLEEIYTDFCSFADPELDAAGFSELYLPNAFERLIVFSLVSENPIKTFRTIMEIDD